MSGMMCSQVLFRLHHQGVSDGLPEVAVTSFTSKKTLPRQGFYYAKSD